MKASFISYLLAGASLVSVSASPLRVIMISESQDAGSSLRFGQPVATIRDKSNWDVPKLTPHHMQGNRTRMPCRDKAIAMSNAFRKALGLPLIEPAKTSGSAHGGIVKIMPFVGTNPTFVEVGPNGIDGKTRGGDNIKVVYPAGQHRQHHGNHRAFRQRLAREPFFTRVHFALMTLGPWEGRAVAFVLGCGLGVLLRMVWVLALVSYRAIRGEREEPEYEHVLFDQYDEVVALPPPNYVVDEKVPIAEESKDVTTGNK